MASTTLFAPQVRAVQPAFVYKVDKDASGSITSVTGSVRVYFNLSSYNTVNDVKYILYTIIDPNKTSTWGTNSVIEAVAAPAGYLYATLLSITEYASVPNENRLYYTVEDEKYVYKGKLSNFETGKDYYYFNQDPDTGEFYIEIDLGDSDKFKELTKNQFYQVQLYFCNSDSITDSITQSWLDANKNSISVASQVTLIRPIPKLADGYPSIETLSGTLYDLPLIKGNIVYEDNSVVETIDTCWFEVGTQKSEIIKNQLGLGFEIPINFTLEADDYSGTLYYITKNGYKKETSVSFTINEYTDGDPLDNIVSNNVLGYVEIPGSAGKKLQRKEMSQIHWDTIHTYTDGNPYYDYDIENLNRYDYRLINGNTVNETASAVKISFDDIFLSDKNTMLAVKYNPNISGFKYVTQEAITNTLGGKYPIIRKNGDTRYKQFNLSGTLYTNASEYDGTGASTSLKGQSCSDFVDHLGEQPSLYVKDGDPRVKVYDTKERLERQARDIALNFLTNGVPKLFRSPEEGNMIVHLSNISFTPNKQLGRAVWDFSATATEICEYTSENIVKYELNDGREFKSIIVTGVSLPEGKPVMIVTPAQEA